MNQQPEEQRKEQRKEQHKEQPETEAEAAVEYVSMRHFIDKTHLFVFFLLGMMLAASVKQEEASLGALAGVIIVMWIAMAIKLGRDDEEIARLKKR